MLPGAYPVLCIISFFILPLIGIHQANAQNGQLFGIVENNIVEINPENGDLTQIALINIPPSLTILKLAYSTKDCVFYGLINSTSVPTLVSIDLQGNFNEIGPITIPNGTVYLIEALSYNPMNNKLYGGVSLNGGIANNDFFSETIVEINPYNAEATFVSSLVPGGTFETDMDAMHFIGNSLYIHDGKPNVISSFYQIDFQSIGAAFAPNEIFSTNFLSIRDLASIGEQLYMTTGDLDFFELGTVSLNLDYYGKTHAAPTYNGQPISGIEYVKKEVLPAISMDTTICEGNELTLTIDINNATVTWNNGQVSNSLTIDSPGIFWADVQVDGCPFVSDTAIVNFGPLVVDLGPDQSICQGEHVILNAFQDGAAYLWHDGSTNPFFEASSEGWHSVLVTIGDCFDTDSLFLEVFPSPSANFGTDTVLCTADSLILSVSPPYTDILWNNGQTTNMITVSVAGTYWVNATNGICDISDTIYVEMDEPFANLGPDLTICEGDSTILSSLQNGAAYLWQDGSTNATYVANEEGWYSVEVMIGNCSDVDSLSLEINPSPVIDLGPDTVICPNSTFTLDAFFDGAIYLWNDGSTNPSLQINEPGVYSVEVSLNDCVATQEIEVEILPSISDINIGTDSTLCLGFQLGLNINAEYADEYLWSNGERGNSISVAESGNYFVIATNECETVTSNIIHLTFEDCNCYFWLPNSFSPNNDGINDMLSPFSDCEILQYEFRIFDRWGDFVFDSNDPNIGWDGMFKGQNANIGVYAYFIKSIVLKGGIEKEIRLEGDVTLLR